MLYMNFESDTTRKNFYKLLTIKKILEDYIKQYTNVFCQLKNVQKKDYETYLLLEYKRLLAIRKNNNYNIDNSRIINLHFVSRARKANELLETIDSMINKVIAEHEYLENGFNQNLYDFVLSDPVYRDIMNEYAFDKYFANKYNYLEADRKEILDDFLCSDGKVKKMSSDMSNQ